MALRGAGRELGLMGGLRARKLEDSGVVMSSLYGEGAMHRRDKGMPATHDLGQEVGGAEIARRLRVGRRSVDNWIADGWEGFCADHGDPGARLQGARRLPGPDMGLRSRPEALRAGIGRGASGTTRLSRQGTPAESGGTLCGFTPRLQPSRIPG